jgi:hypothetical protein
MSHPFTRVVFRVGDDDSKRLAEGFSYFEPKDLRNLDIGQAIARVERSDFDFNLTVPPPDEPDKDEATLHRQEVTTVSRNKYGTARAEVEAMLAKSRATPTPDKPPAASPSAKSTAFAPQPQPTRAAEVPPPSPPVVIPQSSEPPKISEVPKPKEQPVPTVKHEPPRDQGKGGAQHTAIQRRIKEAGEKLGFLSDIEKQIPNSEESVDVLLARSDQTIACEVAMSKSNTIDHEVGNIVKCLKAGYPKVAVISDDKEHLQKISVAVSVSLGPETAERISYYQRLRRGRRRSARALPRWPCRPTSPRR